MKSIVFFALLVLCSTVVLGSELELEHDSAHGPGAIMMEIGAQEHVATEAQTEAELAAQIEHAVETETEQVIAEALEKGLCRNSKGDIFSCPKAAPVKVVEKRVVVVKNTPAQFFYQDAPALRITSRHSRASLNSAHSDNLSRLLHSHRLQKFANNHSIRRMERRHLLSQHVAQLKALHDRHERELARMKARQLEELHAMDLQLSHEKHADKLHVNGHVHRSIKRPGVRRLRAERFD